MIPAKRRLNPLHEIAAFVIIMLLFLFVFAPLQYHFTLGASAETVDQSVSLREVTSMLPLTIGSYLMIGAIAPILLYAGNYLLCRASGSLPKRSKRWTVAAVTAILILSGVMLVAGFAIILFQMENFMDIQNILSGM